MASCIHLRASRLVASYLPANDIVWGIRYCVSKMGRILAKLTAETHMLVLYEHYHE